MCRTILGMCLGSTPTRFRQSLVDSVALAGVRTAKGASLGRVLDPSWPQIFLAENNSADAKRVCSRFARRFCNPTQKYRCQPRSCSCAGVGCGVLGATRLRGSDFGLAKILGPTRLTLCDSLPLKHYRSFSMIVAERVRCSIDGRKSYSARSCAGDYPATRTRLCCLL
jgi:hypothetical protein